MRGFKSNIHDLVQMNFTKTAAAQRAKCSGEALDKECLRVFGMKWDDIKAEQRKDKNEFLSNRPIGKTSYAYSHRLARL